MFFCWLIPGAALIVGVALIFFEGYIGYSGGNPWSFQASVLFFGPPAAAAIGCGIMSSLIRITRKEGHNKITQKKVFSKTLSFFLIQIIVAPFTAFTIVLGCGVVTTLFSP